jgi:hypothetical protein
VIEDRGGAGALVYADAGFGVIKRIVGVGETWSAGSVTLCKKSDKTEVVLQGVEPVSVKGQIRLDGIGARMTHYAKPDGSSDPNTHLVGTMPGKPSDLQPPQGFHVATTCPNVRAPVGELVVTLTKTGPVGGTLDGLRVRYTADGQLHELILSFFFGLCGTGPDTKPCLKSG